MAGEDTGRISYLRAQDAMNDASALTVDTAANIADKTATINTSNKKQGRVCYDSTNHRLMTADGSTATSKWYVPDGSSNVTPA